MRTGVLQVLIWKRAKDPYRNCWSLPGGFLARGERLEESIRRHLAAKVDVRELSHLEQLETLSDPDRHPGEWQLATAYLGLVPTDVDPSVPADTSWHPLAAPTLSDEEAQSTAALGHDVSATNLKRVLLRRGVLEPTGDRRLPGRVGGRPAELYRFHTRALAITDQFAVQRPPGT